MIPLQEFSNGQPVNRLTPYAVFNRLAKFLGDNARPRHFKRDRLFEGLELYPETQKDLVRLNKALDGIESGDTLSAEEKAKKWEDLYRAIRVIRTDSLAEYATSVRKNEDQSLYQEVEILRDLLDEWSIASKKNWQRAETRIFEKIKWPIWALMVFIAVGVALVPITGGISLAVGAISISAGLLGTAIGLKVKFDSIRTKPKEETFQWEYRAKQIAKISALVIGCAAAVVAGLVSFGVMPAVVGFVALGVALVAAAIPLTMKLYKKISHALTSKEAHLEGAPEENPLLGVDLPEAAEHRTDVLPRSAKIGSHVRILSQFGLEISSKRGTEGLQGKPIQNQSTSFSEVGKTGIRLFDVRHRVESKHGETAFLIEMTHRKTLGQNRT